MMSPKRSASLTGLVVAVLVAIGGCGDSSGGSPVDPPDLGCELGAKECRADGLYTCNADGVFERTEVCSACEASPEPHCTVSCGDAGVTSVCDGDAVKSCSGGALRACSPGRCLMAGKQAVCATKEGVSACVSRRADGTQVALACAEGGAISSTQVCDRRSGECKAAAFDCGALASAPADRLTCEPTTGSFFTSCSAGQPNALLCGANTKCRADGSTNCYTAPAAGTSCGEGVACYPGLHCVQDAAAGASCVQPAGVLACSSTDVLAVCTDVDTGFACVKGTVWRWRNLTTAGGSCTNNRVLLDAGGMCIPGLADCKPGLECRRSRYDIAGTCRAPQPNAPAECTLTGQVSLGRSCIYDWHACRDGHYYDIDCRAVNVAGNIITLCDCSIDGVRGQSFSGSEICNVTDTTMLDTRARASCGWRISTVEVAP